jgi:uncharacterized protein YwqG
MATQSDVLAKLEHLKRPAWKPVVRDGDGEPTSSKFSGSAWLPPGEAWPTCPNCGEPMQLFVQLNAATLPVTALGEGLLQLFYCTSDEPLCEDDCEAYSPFSRSVLARRIDLAGGGRAGEPPAGAFPAKHIAAWEQVDEYPNWEECSQNGVELTEAEESLLDGIPLDGDKLLGWPRWIQGVEYPECTECGEPMTLVFQIDSEDNLPYMFGDVGTGHLTRCPAHPDIMSFHWACH